MKLIIKQHNQTIFHQRLLMILILAIITLAKAQAQTDSSYIEPALEATDSLRRQMGFSDKAVEKQLDKIKKMPLLLNDTVATQKKQKRDWATWSPDPQRALWMALVIPGGGQIYNRKYWKLPIVYGCFVGVTYAIVWTSNQYSDYMRGYKEACDVDPNTNYHLKLLPAGYPENQAEQYMLTQLNSFRRYRDLCIVAGVAVFALSVIDAYVDAQLANFDVSPDLSMKIRPKFDTVYNTGETAVGCQVQFNF